MRPIRILLLATMTLFVLSGCCWTDHSATIKEVAEPMLHELQDFYQKHKRFPTTQERDVMLEKVGCRVKGDRCEYKHKKMILQEWIAVDYYNIRMTYGNTYCSLYLNSKDGSVDKLICRQEPCIEFGQ